MGAHAVPGLQRKHSSVGKAHGGVGVRVLRGTQGLPVEVTGLDILVTERAQGYLKHFVFIELHDAQFPDVAVERVLGDGPCVLGRHLGIGFNAHIAEAGLFPQPAGHGLEVFPEALFQLQVNGLQILGFHMGEEFPDGESQHLLLQPGIGPAESFQEEPLLGLHLLHASHPHQGAGHQEASDEGFPVVHLLFLYVFDGGVFGLQLVQEAGIFGAAGPQALFPFPAAFHNAEAADALKFSFLQFGHVGEAEEGVGVFHPNLRVLLHPLSHNLHLPPVQAVFFRALHKDVLGYLGGAGIALRAAGIAYHHGIVSLLVPFPAYFQVPGGMQGLSVIRVDAVQGKIGLVLRPFPVVLISSEGGYRNRRSTHQAHVRVGVVQAQVVLGTGPHTLQGGLHSVQVPVLFLHQGVEAAAAGGFALGQKGSAKGFHLIRYIQHLPQEIEGFSFQGDLLAPVLGPESVFQIVVVRGGEGGHLAVGTVVVGYEESVFGAVEPQRNHGVRQAAGLLVIDFPDPQLEPARLHILFQRAVQALDEPHPLIGPCPRKGAQDQREAQQNLFEGFFHTYSLSRTQRSGAAMR